MRFRVILLVVATSSLVLVSFLVPLALVLRSFAANEAMSKATTQAQSLAPLVGTDTLRAVVDGMNAENGGSTITIFLPGNPRACRTLAVDRSYSDVVPFLVNFQVNYIARYKFLHHYHDWVFLPCV